MIKTYLAMETENTGDIEDVIDDEVEKLLDIKSNVKLLVYYPHRIAQSMQLSMLQDTINISPLLPEERFITIMIDSDATSADEYTVYTKLMIRGLEIAKNSRVKELGTDQVNHVTHRISE